MRLISSLFSLFLPLLSLGSIAQTLSKPALHFETIQHPKLNRIGPIVSIVEDIHGFMWFGGESGLARFDGYQIIIYRHEKSNPLSLDSSFIWDLKIDGRGDLWVATDAGLNKYSYEENLFYRYLGEEIVGQPWKAGAVFSVIPDDNFIWFVSSEGLQRLNVESREVEKYQLANSGSERVGITHIRTIQKIDANTLLLGAFRGDIYSFDINKHRFTKVFTAGYNGNERVMSMYRDEDSSTFWIGTLLGLYRYEAKSGEVKFFDGNLEERSSLTTGSVRGVIRDSEGNLIVSMDGGGINILDENKNIFHHYQTIAGDETSLQFPKVRSIYKDSNSNIWIGHFPMGLSRINRYAKTFSNYKPLEGNSNSISHRSILSVDEDSFGNVWVGTEYGLNKIELETGKVDRYPANVIGDNGLPAYAALAVEVDYLGDIWIGTWEGGVSRLDVKSNKFKHYFYDPDNNKSVYGTQVWAVYEDSRKDLWVGSYDGVVNRYIRKDDSFLRVYLNRDKERMGRVTVFYEDTDNDFWVGTDNGLYLLDRDTYQFELFVNDPQNPESISDNRITAINQDLKGDIWVATWSGGVNVYDKKHKIFRTYTNEDGLGDDLVNGILIQDQNNIWFSTGNGISKFELDKNKFSTFTTRHGLPGDVFNRPAYLKTKNGKLCFGSTDGLTIFDPYDMVTNNVLPKIQFTDFRVNNKSVKIREKNGEFNKTINYVGNVVLDYKESIFSIDFVALNYLMPEKNQYAYQLEGFNQDWVMAGNSRTATYTNLDPGDYVFKVIASNNEGVWNREGRSIAIKVLPPWWETSLAYAMYFMIVILLIYWFIHTQRQKVILIKEKLEHERLKHTQSELLQKKSMQSLSLLVSGVAHEINNPNNFAYSNVYNIETELINFKTKIFQAAGADADESVLEDFDRDFDKLFKMLSTMKNGTARIKDIVESLRVFSSSDQAGLKEVDLVHDLKLIVELLAPTYEKDVKFELSLPERQGYFGNPVELNQLFVNVITNACQAIETKNAQEAEQRISVVSVKLYDEDKSIVVSIEDEGCGMTNETLEHLFDPFYTTREVGSGAGLGLSMAYGIVEKHKGKIEVESKLGVGSTFTITFPEDGLERLS